MIFIVEAQRLFRPDVHTLVKVFETVICRHSVDILLWNLVCSLFKN